MNGAVHQTIGLPLGWETMPATEADSWRARLREITAEKRAKSPTRAGQPTRDETEYLRARCTGCRWGTTVIRNGMTNASTHTRRTGHRVVVEWTRVVSYRAAGVAA